MQLTEADHALAARIAAAHPLEASNEVPPLREFVVQIKRGRAIRLTLEAMGVDALAVAEQHEGLCEQGEYVSVKLRPPRTVAQQIDALKAGWMFVGAAHQGGDSHCASCDFNAVTKEPRPYGEGTAYETVSECTLGQRASDKPLDCPAYEAHTEDERCDLSRAVAHRVEAREFAA